MANMWLLVPVGPIDGMFHLVYEMEGTSMLFPLKACSGGQLSI